jgi:hypothetical protein
MCEFFPLQLLPNVVASKNSKQLVVYFVNEGEGCSWIGHKETLEAYLLQCKDKALKRSDRAEAAVTFQDTEQNAFESTSTTVQCYNYTCSRQVFSRKGQ